MGIETLVNSVFGRRVTFGTTLELQDGNLVVEDQLFPNRVALIGACNNQQADPDNPEEYVIPTNVPTPILRLDDIQFLRNADPDRTPSEVMLSFRDVYQGGGRTFEVAIISRTVAQLGGDVDEADTVIPVSTLYTGKVTRMANIGAHPLMIVHGTSFVHADVLVVAGGQRPNTPAVGDLTSDILGNYVTGDYIYFQHADGRVHAFWFDLTGSDTVPAAVTALVAGATAGSTATRVDISGAGSASAAAAIISAAITANESLPITGYHATANVDLESDEEGADGNAWTLVNVSTGVTAITTPAGGSATASISRRLMKYDPSTDEWSNLLNAAGNPQRLVVGTRDAGAVRESATQVNITGGMTSIMSAADVAVASVDDITFTSGSSNVVSTVAAGTAVNGDLTRIGEALWVDAGGVWYIFGGSTGNGATVLSDMVATFVPSTGVATDTTDVLDDPTRWMGGYYDAVTDRIYAAGGLTADGAQDKTYIYSVGGTAFLTTPVAGRMTEKKYAFAFAAINGSLYTFGGYKASGESARVDRFDPDSLTWSNRGALLTAGAGGAIGVIANRIYYADEDEGGKYNVGVGNLSDEFVGFPATPFYAQLEWEIVLVTGTGTTRARGRDTDALVVTRGQRGSTAIAHSDRPDITLDPNALHAELSESFAQMASLSTADFLAMPWRATADCPYLEEGMNFAHLAGFYAAFKSNSERVVIASLGVHPPNEDPRKEYTRAEEATWVNHLRNFTRQNYNGQMVGKILDGKTDNDGDGKPDTYALWFVKDGSIPTGSPPMESGSVERDRNGRPIDLGKHLIVVAAYGFANDREYLEKLSGASRGVLRSGHPHYIGMLSTLDESVGSTGVATQGFVPMRPLPLDVENDLVGSRYIVPTLRSNGWRWTNGFTFAYNVSRSSRSDWVFASSVRRAMALTRSIRFIIDRFAGKSTLDYSAQTAMDHEISQKIQNFVAAGIVGPETTHQIIVSADDIVLGQAQVKLSIQIVGELTNVDMIAALTV